MPTYSGTASLVGTAIMMFRYAAPDPPLQKVAAPANTDFALTAANKGNNGFIPTGTTVAVKFAGINPWGETLPSAEATVVVNTPNNAVNVALASGKILQAGVTGTRVYYGNGAGNENQWILDDGNGNATILSLTAGNAGTPAARSTAFVPDSDGDEVGASAAFKWMNDALTKIAQEAGGIFARVGVNTQTGQIYYTIGGKWKEFVGYRWDQWLVRGATINDIFYRFNVKGVSAMIVQETNDYRTVVALWPVPNLSGSTTTLSGTLAAGDAIANIVSSTGFTANGQCLIDNEQMFFGAPTATTLPDLIRGTGGSSIAAHASGTTVTELKGTLYGFRYPAVYVPGDSLLTLDTPPAWDVPIRLYMLAEYRAHEQNVEEAQALRKEFMSECLKLRSQRADAVKSMQVGMPMDARSFGIGRTLIP